MSETTSQTLRKVELDPTSIAVSRFDEPEGGKTRLHVGGRLRIDAPQPFDRHRVQAALISGQGEVLWVDDNTVDPDFAPLPAPDGAPSSFVFGYLPSMPTALVERAAHLELRLSSRVAVVSSTLEFDLATLEHDPQTGQRWTRARAGRDPGVQAMGSPSGLLPQATLIVTRPEPEQRYQILTRCQVPDGIVFETINFRMALLDAEGDVLHSDDTNDWDNPPYDGLVISAKRLEVPTTFAARATRLRLTLHVLGRWVPPAVRIPTADLTRLASF